MKARVSVLFAIGLLAATPALAQRSTPTTPVKKVDPNAEAKAKAKADKKAAEQAKEAAHDAAQDAAKAAEDYEDQFRKFLAEARATAQAPSTPDSLWMSSLADDPRARRVNDLVTVRVSEVMNATGSADSALDKNSNASASVSNLFGLESHLPDWLDPTSLVSTAADSQFKGSGSTGRSGSLSAVITARVAEVLPNGDLALEGVREVDINGDRQIIVLTGVVRPVDVQQGNVVASQSIGQMRIRYFGNGLIKDNLQPGLLVRILNKIF